MHHKQTSKFTFCNQFTRQLREAWALFSCLHLLCEVYENISISRLFLRADWLMVGRLWSRKEWSKTAGACSAIFPKPIPSVPWAGRQVGLEPPQPSLPPPSLLIPQGWTSFGKMDGQTVLGITNAKEFSVIQDWSQICQFLLFWNFHCKTFILHVNSGCNNSEFVSSPSRESFELSVSKSLSFINIQMHNIYICDHVIP